MTYKLAMIMDPIESITIEKDTSFAILLAAQQLGWEIHYIKPEDIYMYDNSVHAKTHRLEVADIKDNHYKILQTDTIALTHFDYIFIRKDPPFDSQYLYLTYLLEHVEAKGVEIINSPKGIRDNNEKLSALQFPDCCAPTLITSSKSQLKDFLVQHQDIICKPLDGMGGKGIFRVKLNDPNVNAIFETVTDNEQALMMAQLFIPEISAGDKRILIINGKPYPKALARIPADGETRGNLAAGGRAVGADLTDQDYRICEIIGPTLKSNGLLFVGIDVIGPYLTEINVTSPTCVRQINTEFGVDIATELLTQIVKPTIL